MSPVAVSRDDRAARSVRAPLRSLSLVVLSLMAPVGALAQVPGNIDWPAETGGTGVVVALDASRGLNFGSGQSLYTGARLTFGMPRAAVWFGGGYAGLAGAGDNVATGGAGFALELSESASAQLSLEAGFGFGRKYGSWIWGVPAGVTVRFGRTGSPAKPFVRAHGIVSGGAGSGTEVGVSGIGGVEVRLAGGMGFHLALQMEKLGEEEALVVGGGISVGH